MKKASVIIFLLLAVCAAKAQNVPALLIQSDPERLSMGASDLPEAYKVLDNNFLDCHINYGIWAPSNVNNHLISAGAGINFPRFRVSVKGKFLADREPGILYNELGIPLGESWSRDLCMELGAACRIVDNFSAGVSIRFFDSSLGSETKANAFMADISGAYSNGVLDAHISLNNLGTPLRYGSSAVSLPVYLVGGVEYELAGFASAEAELAYVFGGQFMASAGFELNYNKTAFLRAGYHFGGDKGLPSFLSCGLGFQMLGIKLNACCLFGSGTLSGTMVFGLGYSF